MQFYGLKNCDTCKKAQKALTEAGIVFNVTDVRVDGVSEAVLSDWIVALGADVLVNRKSTTWRGLSDADKAAAVGDGAVRLIVANPTLMKRPVIVVGDMIHVGWSREVQAALL